MKDNKLVEEFIEFAELVIAGTVTTDMWEKYAINHYFDEALEKARIELVKTLINFDPKGEGKPLSSDVKEKLEKIKNELKEQNT